MGPGSIVADRFEVVRPLARGGMADIFEAVDTGTGARVALKILREELTNDADTVVRFRREAQAAGSIRHRHVARVFDCGVTERNRPFIVMELLEGRDLAQELDARGVLPMAEGVKIIIEACRGMIAAHEVGIVHRDLKPSNLFLAQDGGRAVTKVLDFGISKYVAKVDENVTLTKALFGSPLYMSPEQFRSAKAADQRSDVWSLGVIFYEVLTGLPPFVAENAPAVGLAITREQHVPPTHRRRSLPKEVDAIIDGALQKDPNDRYQSMAELLSALEGVLPRQRDDTPTQMQALPAGASVPPRPSPAPVGLPVGASSVPPAQPAAIRTNLSSYPAPPVPRIVADDPTTLDVTREIVPPPASPSSLPPDAGRGSDPRAFALPIPTPAPVPFRSTEPAASTVPPQPMSRRGPLLFGVIMLFVGAAGATAFFLLRTTPSSRQPVAVAPPAASSAAPVQQAAEAAPPLDSAAEPPDAPPSPAPAVSVSASAEEPKPSGPKKKKKSAPPPAQTNDKGLFMPKGI